MQAGRPLQCPPGRSADHGPAPTSSPTAAARPPARTSSGPRRGRRPPPPVPASRAAKLTRHRPRRARRAPVRRQVDAPVAGVPALGGRVVAGDHKDRTGERPLTGAGHGVDPPPAPVPEATAAGPRPAGSRLFVDVARLHTVDVTGVPYVPIRESVDGARGRVRSVDNSVTFATNGWRLSGPKPFDAVCGGDGEVIHWSRGPFSCADLDVLVVDGANVVGSRRTAGGTTDPARPPGCTPGYRNPGPGGERRPRSRGPCAGRCPGGCDRCSRGRAPGGEGGDTGSWPRWTAPWATAERWPW